MNSYCFHRLLGDLRRGEPPSDRRIADGGPAVLAEARALGSEVVGLQTCYLEAERFDADGLRAAAGEMELILEWGHPEGLAFGARPAEEPKMLAWLERAAELGTGLFRVVVGGPRLRAAEPLESQISRVVAPLRRCAERADELGLTVAIENHVDLTTGELAVLIERVDRSNVGICLDVANALRLGDDPSLASETVVPLVRMVHLRDVEPLENVADAVAGPRTLPFGEGCVPLEPTLARSARSLAGRAPVLVELAQLGVGPSERDLIASGLEWLRGYRARRV